MEITNEHYGDFCDYKNCKHFCRYICEGKSRKSCQRIKDKENIDKLKDENDLKLTPEIVQQNGFIRHIEYESKFTIDKQYQFYKIPNTAELNRGESWHLIYDVKSGYFYIEDDRVIKIVTINDFRMALKLMGLKEIAENLKLK